MSTMRDGIENAFLRLTAGALLCLALTAPSFAAAAAAMDAASSGERAAVSGAVSQTANENPAGTPDASAGAKIGLALILLGVTFLAFRRTAGPRRTPTRVTGVIALVIAAGLGLQTVGTSAAREGLATTAEGLGIPHSAFGIGSLAPARDSDPDLKAAPAPEQLAARRPPRPPTPIPTRPPAATVTPVIS